LKQDDLTLMISAYADELSHFPGDIVHHVLMEWPNKSRWFPAWHDLFDNLSWRTNKRQFLLDALLKGPKEMPSNVTGILAETLKRM